MLKYRYYFVVAIFLVGIMLFFMIYSNYIKVKQQQIIHQRYDSAASALQLEIKKLILIKEKATLGIALSLTNDIQLQQYLQQGYIPVDYYKSLIHLYDKSTLYRNIWIQIVDKQGKSIYRSWTSRHNDMVAKRRKDLAEVEKLHKAISSISVGLYGLTIKSIVPIFSNKNFLGILEIISHFNSIDRILQKEGIKSIVLATKKQTKHLEYPFTKLFLQGHYIANFDAPKEMQKLLQEYGLEKIFTKKYVIYKDKLITVYPLQDISNQTIGYYIAIKNLKSISQRKFAYFQFQWIAITLLLVVAFFALINVILYYLMKQQKVYYKNIIDSSNNIVIINDKEKILEANRTFFRYFTHYKTIEEFLQKHTCICNFFVTQEGYLSKEDLTYKWIDTVLETPEKLHKAKMDIDGKTYFFMVCASLIATKPDHYSVIFSDITKEEMYKEKLKNLTIKDPLTNLYNRRFYEVNIEKEIQNARRYGYPLSLIMFDIDFFKKVNDVHGHSIGDEILIHHSKIIYNAVRKNDFVCRVGGEEFIIILPHTTDKEALKIAEKLRMKIEKDSTVIPITMSFGVTQHISGETKDHFYKRVDKSLYRAKENGRNRVEVG